MLRKFSLFLFPFSISLLFSLTSCYNVLQSKIPKNSEGEAVNLAALVSKREVDTHVPAPEEIHASAALSPDTIFVTWSEVGTATSYLLERAVTELDADGNPAEPDESDFVTLSKFVYGTSYTDSIVSSPIYGSAAYKRAYYYRVSAENPRLKYESSDFTATETPGTLFPPVTVLSATQGASSSYIELTWEKVKNASAYKIYRSTFSDGSGASLIATVTGDLSRYRNTLDSAGQGVEFYYSIVAVNSLGSESVVSPVVLGYSLVDGAPPQVGNVRVTSGRGNSINSITIEWDAVTASREVKYAIYRTSSDDSSSKLLKDDLDAATPYTDNKGLAQNVYYYYQVQAYCLADDNSRLKGPISDSSATSANPAEGFILSAPASLSVQNKDTATCTLTFPAALGSADCPSDSGLSASYNNYTYAVYASETQAGEFSLLDSFNDTGSELTSKDGSYSCDVPAKKFYKVATSRTEGPSIESAKSMVAAPVPYAAETLAASKHAFIEGVTTSGNANDAGVYPVRITWSEPGGGADGGYYVYRSTKQASGFRKITDTPVLPDESGSLSYTDSYEAAKPGTIYYYRVLSLNSLGQGANYSAVDSGWGALTHDQYMREYNKTIKKSHTKLTLMHKPSTSALGSESVSGDLSGNVSYKAEMSGLGARIIMYYSDYADFYINNDESLGYYFQVTGNTNTSANMSANGTMDGTVTCKGMYPGTVKYDKIEIKGGDAGGGSYVITPDGFDSADVKWQVGSE